MRKLYALLRWLIILLLFLLVLIAFIVESPSTVLEVFRTPLKSQGVEFGEIKGGLLSGFKLTDVNYKNQIEAKEVALKVDLEALKNRVLVVDNLVLKDAKIDKDFLASLIDTNSTDEKTSTESNLSLPFDRVVVNNADISLQNVVYKEYEVYSAKLHIDNLDTNMKSQYKGQLNFALDSNIAKATLKGSFENEHYNIKGKVEGEKDFIATFVEEQNVTLLTNPIVTVEAKGDLQKVDYKLNVHQLDIEQNEYEIHTKNLYTVGSYAIEEKDLVTTLKTDINSNVGALKLDADASLNLDDLNNTLSFKVDGVFTPKKSHLVSGLKEQNITIEKFPTINIFAKGDMKNVEFRAKIEGLKATQNKIALDLKDFDAKGSLKPLRGDVNLVASTHFGSSVANGEIGLISNLNFNDINNSLVFDVKTDLEVHNDFLNPFLKDTNVTLNGDNKIALLAKGDMKYVQFSTLLKDVKGKQNDIKFHLKDLDVKGSTKPLKGDIDVKAKTHFASSVSDGFIDLESRLNFNDINNSLVFDVKSDLSVHNGFLNPFLEDANVTLNGDSKIALLAKGDMKNIEFSTLLKDVKGKQNDIKFHLKDLDIKGSSSPLKGDIDVKAKTHFASSVSDGFIDLKSKLNLNDINSSLKFDLNSNLKIHNSYLNPILKDSNVTLRGDSNLNLKAKGTMKEVEFSTLLKGLKGKQNDIKFHLKDLDVKGTTKPLQGDTNIVTLTHFASSVADGKLNGKVKLNFKDINSTLNLDSHLKVNLHAKYINPLLKEQKMAIQGEIPIELTAKGGFKKLLIKLDANAKVLKDNKLSTIKVNASPIELNLKSNQVKGLLKIKSDGKDLGLNMETSFSGDFTKPKEMKIKNKIDVNNFQMFGIDLSSLQPLTLEMNNGKDGLTIKLNSPKINLTAKSKDNDYFTFKLHTKEIVISQIVKDLPEELQGKFIKIDIDGKVTLSSQYFNIYGRVASINGFMLNIDAENNAQGLLAKLYTKHLKVEANGVLSSKDIEAKVTIDSLTKLQEELLSLYPFKMVNVDGGLELTAKLQEEKLRATLLSEKIKFEAFSLKDVAIDANYANDLITINRLNFKTRGFDDKSLNEDFYLNQRAKIHLGQRRDIFLDMHPNINIQATGTSENLEGDFKINKLPLGHPTYGNMVLNCDVHYKQYGLKKEITGDIRLNKLKLFYEAKYLDADYDNDVVVITKKDKQKEKERDVFLEDTAIDLSIYAPYAKYRTRDIDLEFTVDLNAKKVFGSPLGMLGKIRNINGRVEQAPKLFSVVDSNIIFGGGKEINPLLDIKVNYELPDVLITIFVHGHAKRPKLDFSSEPPMPKKDILSYLLLGVSTADLAKGESSLGREAQLFIMNQAARDFAYEVELDRVFIKDDGTGEGYAVQVGKKINDNTMFVIENSKEGNSFILEYEINKHLKVEVGQHQKTIPSQSIDVYFRKKFR